MSYFVKVEDASTIRKSVLESTKETILMLKRYQFLLDIKDQKKTLMTTISKDMKDLIALISELEKVVPAESLKEIQAFLPKPEKKERIASKKGKKGKSVKEKKVEEKPVVVAPPKPKPLSEMEKLEKALGDIESRLSQL